MSIEDDAHVRIMKWLFAYGNSGNPLAAGQSCDLAVELFSIVDAAEAQGKAGLVDSLLEKQAAVLGHAVTRIYEERFGVEINTAADVRGMLDFFARCAEVADDQL